MNLIADFLYGKKTYLVSAVIFILGGLQALGVEVPTELYAILGSLLGVTLRAGIAKVE
jgi:hypothetical protein